MKGVSDRLATEVPPTTAPLGAAGATKTKPAQSARTGHIILPSRLRAAANRSNISSPLVAGYRLMRARIRSRVLTHLRRVRTNRFTSSRRWRGFPGPAPAPGGPGLAFALVHGLHPGHRDGAVPLNQLRLNPL